jgi:hypothetical protein
MSPPWPIAAPAPVIESSSRKIPSPYSRPGRRNSPHELGLKSRRQERAAADELEEAAEVGRRRDDTCSAAVRRGDGGRSRPYAEAPNEQLPDGGETGSRDRSPEHSRVLYLT